VLALVVEKLKAPEDAQESVDLNQLQQVLLVGSFFLG
jgi:hypothetical protein